MDLRGFLPELKTWSLSRITCAAGLLALSAGASYCIYRQLQRQRAPPVHTEPPHEPEDVLEQAVDAPVVLQVFEPNLHLIVAKPHHDAPAVVLEVIGVQLAEGTLLQFLRLPPNQDSAEEELFRAQVDAPNLEPLPTQPQEEPEAANPPVDAGELISAWYDVKFLSSDSYTSPALSLFIKRYFLGMIRGPESRLCWFETTESCFVDDEGIPYHSHREDCFSVIQSASGEVTEFVSCDRVETTDMPPEEVQTFTKLTCKYLYVGPDGQVDASTWVQEDTHDSPLYSDSESQPDSEESEVEESEVPFMSDHLEERGISDMDLKLCALRQVFSTLLASIHFQNFLFAAGRKILMRLAAANNQDVVGVQLVYEALIEFLRRPSNKQSIESELSEAQILHFNFLDVFFELLLFGYCKQGLVFQTFTGGFLERFSSLMSMWDVDVWTPAARTFFTELIDQLTVLCEALFSCPVEIYSDPVTLGCAVSNLLWSHVQLMETL